MIAIFASTILAVGMPLPAEEPGDRGPALTFLPAGTVVGSTPPRGWSHLVIKSVPRIESGEVATLPSMARSTATLFRTVVLADVRRPADQSGPYRLERIGLGLCVPFQEADTVVTTTEETPARASLGLIEGQVLSLAQAELEKGRVLASSSTFTLYGGPCLLQTKTGHVGVWVLYGLLVDPSSGALDVAVWAIAADAASPVAPGMLVQIAPRLVYNCGLDVAAVRILGAIPVNWSFAIKSLPPGRVVAIPMKQRDLFRRPREISASPAAFERQLRALIAKP